MDLNEDVEEDAPPALDEQEGSEDDSEEEEEEGEPDEFIDVLDVLDGRGEPYMSDDESSKPSKEAAPSQKTLVGEDSDSKDNEEVGSGGESEDDEEDDEDEDVGGDGDEDVEVDEENAISASEDEDVDTDALDKLDAFVSSLETASKRKAGDDDTLSKDNTSIPKKRKLQPERTEAGLESEFGAKLAGMDLNLNTLKFPP